MISASPKGSWRKEHLFALGQAINRHDMYSEQIARCEERITEALAARCQPNDAGEDNGKAEAEELVERMMGVDPTAIPAIGPEISRTIASGIGPDPDAFSAAVRFCSWLGLAPGTSISGGKKLPSRGKRPDTNRVGRALRMAAMTASRLRSFIGAKHRARPMRMDACKAVKATAHELARLIRAMPTKGTEYVERGMEEFENQQKVRKMTRPWREARSMGFRLEEGTSPDSVVPAA